MANEASQSIQMVVPWMYIIISLKFLEVNSHGRLIEPPSRASMWRYGFDTPPNYNDHELYCGGFTRQWQRNGGKCGICGDPWDAPQPRPHEAGGKYGQGIIVRKYKTGSSFTIRVELTANHRGYFEFRLCPNNAPKKVATQQCLDKYLLRRSKVMSKEDENFHETRFYPGIENKVYEMKYQLPPSLTCTQCVLQWKYVAANNWGTCANGTGAVGCGPQEEFRSCADISIQDTAGTADGTPYDDDVQTTTKAQTTQTEASTTEETNEIPNEVQKEAKTADVLYVISLALFSLVVIVGLFTLLYVYYYHAGDRIERWTKAGKGAACWTTMKTNIRSCTRRDKDEQKAPVPPPRTRKLSIGFKGVPENLV